MMKAILRPVRNEYGKRIRKDYENHRIRLPRSSIKRYEPRADGVSNTVTSVQKDNYLIEKNMDANLIKNLPEELKGKRLRIRKLTPRECFRLMGVREKEIDKIQQTKFLKNDVKPAENQYDPNAKPISNSQQYKMAGNSIVVDCLFYIFRNLFIGEPAEEKTTLF